MVGVCGTVSLPAMRAGQIGLCLATVIARVSDKWREAGPLDASAQQIAYARAKTSIQHSTLGVFADRYIGIVNQADRSPLLF